MRFEHSPEDLGELSSLLGSIGAQDALIRKLGKNHNDKNQIYCGSGFKPLFPHFDLQFNERAQSISNKKEGHYRTETILGAEFRNFSWLDTSGILVPGKSLKIILYPQYPEARLSAFETADGGVPESLSIKFTKRYPDAVRYLILARVGTGSAVGIMVPYPTEQLIDDIANLPTAPESRVWKSLQLSLPREKALKAALKGVMNRAILGCRLDNERNTRPFNGTQVCGYTLEHELGIAPNSDSHGDFRGIELKAHTQKKVTLFTPEPDGGLYAEGFPQFMKQYGYQKPTGEYRVTGIHRAGETSNRTGLRLEICRYDPNVTIAKQMADDIEVALIDSDDNIAASWSLNRLLNCWGAKHNEVVYVTASKSPNRDYTSLSRNFRYQVSFEEPVIWCRQTSPDQLLRAIASGTIFLDPAPKFDPDNPQNNKRRSQWRVNDITKAVSVLYDHVEKVNVTH